MAPKLSALAALAVGVLAFAVSMASAQQPPNVVPSRGEVAGHGYAYWMERHWQFAFAMSKSSAQSRNHCQSLTANGKQVAFLIGASTGTHSCSESLGLPIYINLVSADCATYSGQHTGFGTSDKQLALCSKHYFAGVGTISASIDGKAVNVKTLVAGTGGFPVHAVAGNVLGVTAGPGRAAAYGVGLLLAGLSKGTHTIHCVAPSVEANVTWAVHVS